MLTFKEKFITSLVLLSSCRLMITDRTKSCDGFVQQV
ncbi:hypothetical protein OROGR_029611 [Orobanche gracilis]